MADETEDEDTSMDWLAVKLSPEQIAEDAAARAYDLTHGTFTVDKSEEETARAFLLEHMTKHNGKYGGAIGGWYSVTFTSTSIGTVVTLECACGKKTDLSGNL